MKIEHIYNDLRMLELSLRDRVGWYRRRAVKAKENNNLRKSDKLDAMARVYEAAWLSLAPICAELFNHTPKSYRKRKREESEMKPSR